MSLTTTLQTVIDDVSRFETLLPNIITSLQHKVQTFSAGNLANFLSKWKSITTDTEIIDMVTGTTIEFESTPVQSRPSAPKNFSDTEVLVIENEITKLLGKGVIVGAERESGDYLSPIFLRDKKDGSHRLILNLKGLNKNITYHHFKMDTLCSVVSLMRPNCFMATIDLKDAYYSVPVCVKHQKFLKFQWKGNYYQFTCFPDGLCCCPRKLTKLIKPIHSSLRLQGHIVAGYIDDNYNQGDTYGECLNTVLETVKVMTELGFCVHPDKSCLVPSQEIVFLGNVLNSVTMTIKLTSDKKQKVMHACKTLQLTATHTIREVARVLGLIVSSFSAVMHGPLHYRQIEREKSLAVKTNKGDYDSQMSLSLQAKTELQWWVDNIDNSFNVIKHEPPSIVINTDASKIGWGGVLGDITCGGHWTPQESQEHINCLELRAALFGLQALLVDESNTHIRLKIDSTTAADAINNMGTIHSIECNNIAFDIWEWCISKHIWVSAEHIAGKHNIAADKESRAIDTSKEWMLNPVFLHQALDRLKAHPDIDMFASRLNAQFPR